MESKPYGFIPDIPSPEDYVLGGLSKLSYEPLRLDGQWEDYLPKSEVQVRRVESSNCTAYGTLNALETLMRKVFGGDYDFSERYLGIASGTRPPGNSPNKVAETLRKVSGVIPETELPFTDEILKIEEYYSPDPLTYPLLSMGEKWLKDYSFGHEWVFTGGTISEKQVKLKEALKYSPVCVSVFAWVQNGDYYIKPSGAEDNHWCMCYGYVDGKYWKIFDSYDNTHKRLEWSYDFKQSKRFSVEKRPQVSGFWSRILDYLKDILT